MDVKDFYDEKNNNKEKKDLNSNEIRDVIKKLRKEKNLSQKNLSEELTKYTHSKCWDGTPLSISCSTIVSWENGSREPRKKHKMLLCKFFDVDLAYLDGASKNKTIVEYKGNTIPLYNQRDMILDDSKTVVDNMLLPFALCDEGSKYFAVIIDNNDIGGFGPEIGDVIIYKRINYPTNNDLHFVKYIDKDNKIKYMNLFVSYYGEKLKYHHYIGCDFDDTKAEVVGKYVCYFSKRILNK